MYDKILFFFDEHGSKRDAPLILNAKPYVSGLKGEGVSYMDEEMMQQSRLLDFDSLRRQKITLVSN